MFFVIKSWTNKESMLGVLPVIWGELIQERGRSFQAGTKTQSTESKIQTDQNNKNKRGTKIVLKQIRDKLLALVWELTGI